MQILARQKNSDKPLRSKLSSGPNFTTLGSYCFVSQVVSCESLEKDDLVRLDAAEKSGLDYYRDAIKSIPLIQHEVKHWFDNHSTVWGLQLILDIYEGLEIISKNKGITSDVSGFYKNKLLKDKLDLIRYPQYYFTKNNVVNTKPWEYQYSQGWLFDKNGRKSKRPIFFTHFKNCYDELITRVPFSMCALLESSAMAQELSTKTHILQAVLSDGERIVEERQLSDKVINELYEPELAEYSVVVHKLSNAFKLTNAVTSYRLSSVLVRFLLNITAPTINKINVRNLNPEIFKRHEKPYEQAKKQGDIASMYPLLVDGLSMYCEQYAIVIDEGNFIETFLSMLKEKCGITKDELINSSRKRIKKLKERAEHLSHEYPAVALIKGLDLFDKYGLFGEFHYDFSESPHSPTILLGDNSMVSLNGEEDLNMEERYFHLSRFYTHLCEFSFACV